MSAAARSDRLRALLAERIVVLDGATGTYLQGRDLTAGDFGGPEYEGCNEHLVLTRPDVIREMHEGYLAAGADIVETDTFGGTRIVLGEYGLQDKVREINATAARLAREVCARFETPNRPRFVALNGPGHEDHLGHGRRHLRPGDRRLRRADGGLARGRRRRALLGDAAGHAQRQGRAPRHRRRRRPGRTLRPRRALGLDRDHGHHARGAVDRGGLRFSGT